VYQKKSEELEADLNVLVEKQTAIEHVRDSMKGKVHAAANATGAARGDQPRWYASM
jgi:hypothetical protein